MRAAISLLVGLPILCILNNFFHYSKSFLWCKVAAATCSSSSDDAARKSGGGEHVKEEDDHNLELQCVICLYNGFQGEKYRVLGECGHGFHVDCIDAWLMQSSSCPLCRCSVAYRPVMKNQLHLSNEDEEFYEALIASFLAFLDHLWALILNPLGFDQSCQDYHAFL